MPPEPSPAKLIGLPLLSGLYCLCRLTLGAASYFSYRTVLVWLVVFLDSLGDILLFGDTLPGDKEYYLLLRFE